MFRLGEKFVVGVSKGATDLHLVQLGDKNVYPEDEGGGGAEKKTITIKAGGGLATLAGTLELEKKFDYFSDGTSYSYWEVVSRNITGHGYVTLRFAHSTGAFGEIHGAEKNFITNIKGLSSSFDLNQDELNAVVCFKPVMKAYPSVDFKSEEYTANYTFGNYPHAGMHNGLSLNNSSTGVVLNPGIVAPSVYSYTLGVHSAFEYTPPRSLRGLNNIPLHINCMYNGAMQAGDAFGYIGTYNSNIIDTAGSSGSVGKVSNLIGYIDLAEDGTITALRDNRYAYTSSSDYTISYTPDTTAYTPTDLKFYDTALPDGRVPVWSTRIKSFVDIPTFRTIPARFADSQEYTVNIEVPGVAANIMSELVSLISYIYDSSLSATQAPINKPVMIFFNTIVSPASSQEEMPNISCNLANSLNSSSALEEYVYDERYRSVLPRNGLITSSIKLGIPVMEVTFSAIVLPDDRVQGTKIATISYTIYHPEAENGILATGETALELDRVLQYQTTS